MIAKIIIEGPDCSGKSTLADRVKNMLFWDAKSLHHKEGNQFKRYLQEYVLGEQVVFNRAHFSENVYSRLWRGGSPFLEQERIILNSICAIDTLTILALPSLEVIQQRYEARKFPQQIKYEELKPCRELFLEELKDFPHILYTAKDYEELDATLKTVYEKVKG